MPYHYTSTFDNCNLSNAYVMLNQYRYPTVDYNLDYATNKFSRVFKDAATFSQKYYGMSELVTLSGIQPIDYKELFPILVFDVSNQSEKLKATVIDIQIQFFFKAAVPAGTQAHALAHALVVSDKLLTFQTDGNKINVVY